MSTTVTVDSRMYPASKDRRTEERRARNVTVPVEQRQAARRAMSRRSN